MAGSEAAWALASRGIPVRLFEMRPVRMTGAHKTPLLAELVCSNSFKSNLPTSPAGQLKVEMRALGSLLLPIAEANSVPAGEALGVDRDKFATAVTAAIEGHELISIERREVTPADLENFAQEGPVVLATGPLTTPGLSAWLAEKTGQHNLYFYDAVSPTVEAASLDLSVIFAQSRYDKGEGDDYLNCPFDKEQYLAFVKALVSAERALPHGVAADDETLEKIKYFAGCTPIEVIAEGGERSLAFGNFKPVGLTDPRTGRRPYAALQLRPENKEKTLYSLVACQNRLKWGEQKRVFQMVPGLENAEFVRFGVIHKNTYLRAPAALDSFLALRSDQRVFVAGQLTGVEGYLESAAMGLYTGVVIAEKLAGREVTPPPRATALGSLLSHLQDDTPRDFAPMNVNWGLFPDPDPAVDGVMRDKGIKRAWKLARAHEGFATWQAGLGN